MITNEIYSAYLNHLLSGKKAACMKVVSELLADEIDILELYVQLFQRAMYEVGELWESNRISVAVEHLATAITESLFALAYPTIFGAEHIGKTAVISCGVNEYHQIGGKMVADVFELYGWDGYFLGANTPVEDLLHFISERNPDVLGLSLSIDTNVPAMRETIERVRGEYPRLDIIVGGQAFRRGGVEIVSQVPNVRYIASLEELMTKILGA
jgi:methanogenic corrinoid protein MtbC1